LRMIAERTPERIKEREEDSSEDGGWRMGDLMDALKRSVEEAKARPKPKGGRRAG
jgi:non-homologous end joining protein Ku